MLSSKNVAFLWLLHDETVIICRYIMKKVDEPFDRKGLEWGILDWMPYLKVLCPLLLPVIWMLICL